MGKKRNVCFMHGLIIVLAATQYLVCTDGGGDSPPTPRPTHGPLMMTFSNDYGLPDWDDFPSCVTQTDDGGYAVLGTTYNYSSGSGYDVIMLRVNGTGHQLWSRRYEYKEGSYYGEVGHRLRLDTDGGFLLLMEARPSDEGDSMAWLMKTDSSGNEIWSRHFRESPECALYSMESTDDGGYILTVSVVSADFRIYLLKLDAAFQQQWVKTYGSGCETGFDARQTPDGGYLVIGECYYGSAGSHAISLKTDGQGILEWQRTFSPPAGWQ